MSRPAVHHLWSGTAALLLVGTLAGQPQGKAARWRPAAAPLMTRWAKDVSPEKVWPEYPRPQLVRPQWVNLNGLWDYAITRKDAADVVAKGEKRAADEEGKRRLLASGVLGLDMYNMREPLAKAGLVYIDEPEED